MRSCRPTIGFLVNSTRDAYQLALWQTVAAEAARLDVNLLCFVAGLFGGGYRHLAHDLIHSEQMDALLAITSAVGGDLSQEDLAREFDRFGPIPLVSIGIELPRAVNLLVDGGPGIERAVDHLVAAHDRRRICFVRGPPNHVEAEVRFAAYRRALERNGLPLEADRVFVGDFDRSAGVRAVRTFLERGVAFDAILAANDYMGLHAMRELQRHGIRVPEDVAVAGFDDIRDAACAEPMFTTVRQPIAELGREAMRWAVRLAHGEPGPRSISFPAEFLARRSCGCFPDAEDAAETPAAAPGALDGAADPERAARALTERFPDLGWQIGEPSWAATLVHALGAPAAERARAFLRAFDRLLVRTELTALAPETWFEVVAACLASPAGDARAGRAGAGALRHGAERLVASRLQQAYLRERTRSAEHAEILQLVADRSHVDQLDVRQVLAATLPQLGVTRFLLCRYRDTSRLEASRYLELLPGRTAGAAPPEEYQPSRTFVPGPGEPRQSWVIAPIIDPDDRAEHWGFLVSEQGSLVPVVHETLAVHVATALKVTALRDRERLHASALEATVELRTRELRAAQGQLLELARHAGMAEIAVGVLHNVGNLLNSVSVCAEQIAAAARSPGLEALDRANVLLAESARYASELLPAQTGARAPHLPTYYAAVAAALHADRDRVRREAADLLEKVALVRDTVRGLQDLARGERNPDLHEPSDLAELIENAIRIQESNVDRTGVRVERALAPNVHVRVPRAQVVHVLVNVIKNALEAMHGTPPERRLLRIELAPHGDGARVRVTDAGDGIRPENRDRIFEYGFTTRPQGYGFGLHTCAKTMAELGGTITAESAGPKLGATFTLVFPATRHEEPGRPRAAVAEPATG